jgi:15-cis-phytoene synthase
MAAMNLAPYEWEKPLLAWAYDAAASPAPDLALITQDPDRLEAAYAHCQALTAAHSRSFSLASRLLPRGERRAVRALYAFCRTVDDIIDQPAGDSQASLEAWRVPEQIARRPDADPVAVAWADARARFRIPPRYAEQLIDGVARDLHQTRYDTFEDLAAYCYGVASTVGFMSMHIVGFHHEAAIPYALRMGVALQLTNILRDVAEDWGMDRLYLPREELERFGLSEADLEAGQVTERWRSLMRFQIDRACRLYAESWPGLALLSRRGQLAIAAAAEFYSAILQDIEAHDYNVFSRRAHLTGWAKIRRVPGLWWRTHRFRYARWQADASYPAWLPCPESGSIRKQTNSQGVETRE